MSETGKPVCGVCGTEVHLKVKNELPYGGMYLCDLHIPFPANCASCPLIVLCEDRVNIYKLWVLCEMPTQDDFERMEMFKTDPSVAYPFKSNPSLKEALFPMGGVYRGKQEKRPPEILFKQTALPDLGSGTASGA